MITNRFSAGRPVSCAQGRYGEMIVVQGNGVRPVRWTGSGAGVDAGMDPPSTAPQIVLDPTPRYYVARVDIHKPGACYYAPPAVTFGPNFPALPPAPFITDLAPQVRPPNTRRAVAKTFLSQSSVSEAAVEDGGKHYAEPPTITLSDSHGKGAVLTAVLSRGDAGPDDPNNDPYTGISEWRIIQAPDFLDESLNDDGLTWYYAFNGSTTIPAVSGIAPLMNPNYRLGIPGGGQWGGNINCSALAPYRTGFEYTVTNGVGTGATMRLVFSDGQWVCQSASVGNVGTSVTSTVFRGARTLESASVGALGKGYDPLKTVTVRIKSGSGVADRDIVIEGYTAGNPQNTQAQGYSLSSITITNPGSGYLVAPQIKIISDSGFGAYATCTVKDGRIDKVTLENGGAGYKTPPQVLVLSGGAEAFAVSRPHLRGKYQCYSRFVDATPEERGGPLPSNLSPVAEIDAGEAAASMTWTLPAVTGRAAKVELWRTTGNQATALYRVYSGNQSTFVDDLTDEEVRDPDRAGYAAMPIVLPNGELNANRFTPPPSDKAVVVRFQDRFWYAVDTGGKEGNTLRYSEVDEPESVPDINEIVLQQNARDADAVQALVPFGPTLLVMQRQHAYALTFSRNPLLDAQVSPIAYRGAVNQRSWDIYAGVCYVLDQRGIYAITQSGGVESLSEAIGDLFRDKIDFGKGTWAFLIVDPVTQVLRAFVAFKDDGSDGYPTRALCYHIDSKTWWMETYPQRVHSATTARLSNGDVRCVYGAAGGHYLLGEGSTDLSRGAITHVTLTNGGAGYRTPPVVQATGGVGAVLRATINGSGKLTGIWIVNPGYGYTSGSVYIGPPNDPSVAGTQATATCIATTNSADTPTFTTYRYKSGCMEYATDVTSPRAMPTVRDIALLYAPQPSACDVALRLYYNNAPHPRRNVAARNRGIGFTADVVDSGFRLDMGGNTAKYGADTGVASAVLAGRTMEDVSSADRHIAAELAGARKTDEPVVFYQLEQRGNAP
jgi:hypothetical protein